MKDKISLVANVELVLIELLLLRKITLLILCRKEGPVKQN